MKGRRSERTYAVRAGSETWAFVPHPDVNSWWFRCHPCVLVVRCEECGTECGQPCKTANGYVVWTHTVRRRNGAELVSKLDFSLGVMLNIERPGRRDLTPDPESGDPSRT